MLMQRELRAVGLQQRSGLVEEASRALRARPDLRRLAILAHRSGGAQGLHLGVVDVTRAILAAEHTRRLGHGSLGVAGFLVGHALAAPVAADRRELLERTLAVMLRTRRIAPGDLEERLGGLRRLDTGADDADAIGKLHHVSDARHLACSAVIDRLG